MRISILSLALAPVLALAAPGLALAEAPTASVYTCTNCPIRIADGAAPTTTVAATLSVDAGACAGADALGGVELRTDLLHSNVGDLQVLLDSPSTSYVLLNRLDDGVHGAGSCAGDDVRAAFSNAPGTLGAGCGASIPAVGGGITAPTPMAALAGPVESGAWAVDVGDFADSGDGVLRDVQLTFYCTAQRLLFGSGFED